MKCCTTKRRSVTAKKMDDRADGRRWVAGGNARLLNKVNVCPVGLEWRREKQTTSVGKYGPRNIEASSSTLPVIRLFYLRQKKQRSIRLHFQFTDGGH